MVMQGAFDEAENSFRSQIKILEEDLARQKVLQSITLPVYPVLDTDCIARRQRLVTDATNRYRREQALMLSVIHGMGMHTAREQLGYAKQQSRPEPTSWLKQQRQNVRRVRLLPRSCLTMFVCAAWTYAPAMILTGGHSHFALLHYWRPSPTYICMSHSSPSTLMAWFARLHVRTPLFWNFFFLRIDTAELAVYICRLILVKLRAVSFDTATAW